MNTTETIALYKESIAVLLAREQLAWLALFSLETQAELLAHISVAEVGKPLADKLIKHYDFVIPVLRSRWAEKRTVVAYYCALAFADLSVEAVGNLERAERQRLILAICTQQLIVEDDDV